MLHAMPDDLISQPAPGAVPKHVRFAILPADAMAALVAGDLATASAVTGITLTPFFITDSACRLWQRRLVQLATEPCGAPWIARAAVSQPDGAVVGFAGFHGPPDGAGMVEVGYRVAEEFRRQGYARAMLTGLLHWAASEPQVTVVRATISPENTASLATIRGFGFAHVGEQWDDEDGLEWIFEVPVHGRTA